MLRLARLLCLLGRHDIVEYPRDWGDGVMVWRFCVRLGCSLIHVRRALHLEQRN